MINIISTKHISALNTIYLSFLLKFTLYSAFDFAISRSVTKFLSTSLSTWVTDKVCPDDWQCHITALSGMAFYYPFENQDESPLHIIS